MSDTREFIFSFEQVIEFGLKQFYGDYERILEMFSGTENIDITETLIKIAKIFLEGKEWEEGYEVYKDSFLKKYPSEKVAIVDRLFILDYFDYSGLEHKYIISLAEKENLTSYIFEPKSEFDKEKFKEYIKNLIKILKKDLHWLIIYPKEQNILGQIENKPHINQSINEAKNNDFQKNKISQASPPNERLTILQIAFKCHYLQVTNYMNEFDGEKETACKEITQKYGYTSPNSWKHFQQKYNTIHTNASNRTDKSMIKNIEKIIPKLEGHPKAKAEAEKELTIAKNKELTR